MKVVFGLMSGALLIAVIAGAALSWDGSAYLFEMLDKQAPFTPNNRLINVPLQLPVLFVNRFTDNLFLLETIFGLMYVLVPLVALVAAWWITRRQAPSLFVWAVFGIGLGTLPGQFLLVAEANMVLQLYWPIVFAILLGMQTRFIPIVVLFGAIILPSHPYATPLFGIATVLAFSTGLRFREERHKLWLWALVFGIATSGAMLRFWLLRTGYETTQLDPGQFIGVIQLALTPLLITALVLMGGVAALVLVTPLVEKYYNRRSVLVLYAFEFLGIVAVGIVLTIWAAIPRTWSWANKFTVVALFTTMFFVAAAALEHLSYRHDVATSTPHQCKHRLRTMQTIAVVFCCVLLVQSLSWMNMLQQLRSTIDQSPWACISAAPVAWLQKTPLDQWALSYAAILVQGRVPQKVVVDGDLCGTATFTKGIPLDEFGPRPWQGGWFNLLPLSQQIIAERDSMRGCWFMLTTGWHETEANSSDNWWRWSDGRNAQIRVIVDRDMDVLVNGRLQSFEQPNQIAILVNGRKQTTVWVTWEDLQPITPFRLSLKRGENIIQLISDKLPGEFGNRLLALSVGNIDLMSADSLERCAFHP